MAMGDGHPTDQGFERPVGIKYGWDITDRDNAGRILSYTVGIH